MINRAMAGIENGRSITRDVRDRVRREYARVRADIPRMVRLHHFPRDCTPQGQPD